MKNGVAVAAATVLVIGGAAGCSPGSPKAKPGTLAPGTAQLSIDDAQATTTAAVNCSTIDWVTTITIGSNTSGATVMLSSAKELGVKLVRIRNVTGFTGGYDSGLEGDAAVVTNGATYDITGTALGYGSKSFERKAQRFSIKIAC